MWIPKVIFEADLPAASEGVPAVYEIGGREYIAVCAAQGNGPRVIVAGSLRPRLRAERLRRMRTWCTRLPKK